MDKEYTVTAVTGVKPSNFPGSMKYDFTISDYQNPVSCFSKFAVTPGQVIYGHVEVNGQYHNFKWGKRPVGVTVTTGKDTSELEREVGQLKTSMAHMRFLVDNILKLLKTDEETIVKGYKYPEPQGEPNFDGLPVIEGPFKQ